MKPPDLAGVVTATMQGVVRGYQLLISPLLGAVLSLSAELFGLCDRSVGAARRIARERPRAAAALPLPPLGRERL